MNKYKNGSKEILEDLLSPCIEAFALVSREGLMIQSINTNEVTDEKISILSAAMLSMSLRTCEIFGEGSLNDIILKTSEGYIIIKKVNKDVLLTVFATSICELEKLLIELRTASNSLMELYN